MFDYMLNEWYRYVSQTFTAAFLKLGIIDILGQKILPCGAILCIEGCLA